MATRDDLYAKFGITAEAGQLLETDLTTILMCIEALDRGWYVEPDGISAAALMEKLDGFTLGQALKRFKGAVKLGPEVTELFGAALAARNRLNHGFYLKHGFKIQTDEGRDLMIADLEEIHDILFRAWQLATTLSGYFMTLLMELKGAEADTVQGGT